MMALPMTENSGVIGPGGMSLGSGGPPDMKMIPHVMALGLYGNIGPVDVVHGFDELIGPPPLPNGFTFHGAQIDVLAGSYDRVQGLMQAGQQMGNVAVFAAVSGLYDNGFVPQSVSRAAQYHGDVGVLSNGNEYHLKVHGINSNLQPQEPQPAFASQVPWTSPNYRKQDNVQVDLTGNYAFGGGWVGSSDLYFGHDVESAATIVLGSNAPAPSGGGGPDVPAPPTGGNTGILTQLTNTTNSWGGNAKLSNFGTLFGMANKFNVGVAYTGGVTTDAAISTIGNLTSNYSWESPISVLSGNGVAPQRVRAATNYLDVHVADVIDVTDRLRLSGALRWDYSAIDQTDLSGTAPDANGNHTFTHFSPAIAATYLINPGVIGYAGYSEAAHVLTPAGIICDDMELPCSTKPPFFVTEPVRKQAISHTYEFGFRGQLPTFETPIVPVQVAWHVGAYQTDVSNDYYLYVDVNRPGRPVYYDVGNTRRQGIKLGLDFVADKFTASIIYNYMNAQFMSYVDLYNPLNSAAGPDGFIHVKPGDYMPGFPPQSLKILVKYQATDKWSVGGSLRAASSTYYNGDEVNAMSQVPGYIVASFNTQYRVTKDLEVFGLVENAFNAKYALFGALVAGGTTDQNQRLVYGQPFSVYGGIRWKFL
jgi:iron complex outermembrane receptor protein